MKVLSHIRSFTAIAILIATASGAQANLLTNGGFESSSSPTATPTGWTNIGHSDGVITYAAFGTPAYEGLNYYDLGGYGDPFGPIGDGIAQTFATTAGSVYSVTFGLSSENSSGNQTLTVSAAGASFDYFLGVTSDGVFKKPFATQTFNFTATGALTTLSFIHTAGGGGSNDALIDGVVVTAAVPEPETYAMMLVGLGVMGAIARRRKVKQTS
jgi:hypothetical protein